MGEADLRDPGALAEVFERALDLVGVDPSDIYEQAQFMDEWPGEDYPGTSLLSAAQAAGATGVATGVAPAWLGTPEWEAECAEFGCHDEEDDWWTVGPDAHRWIPGD